MPNFINKAIRQVATASQKSINHTQAPTLGKTTKDKVRYMAPTPVHGTQAGRRITQLEDAKQSTKNP